MNEGTTVTKYILFSYTIGSGTFDFLLNVSTEDRDSLVEELHKTCKLALNQASQEDSHRLTELIAKRLKEDFMCGPYPSSTD